jgi:hypothetical protein
MAAGAKPCLADDQSEDVEQMAAYWSYIYSWTPGSTRGMSQSGWAGMT